MCYNEIGLCAQNVCRYHSSDLLNSIAKADVIIEGEKGSSLWTHNFCYVNSNYEN
jgi:hypothetical protein